jgi:type 1 fimbriae regulatory protein FimE
MPNTENGTVALRIVGGTHHSGGPPRRQKNSERRTLEYLTEHEVEALREAARRRGRYGHRDQTMILLAFRHALRVSELVALRWDQIDFLQGHLFVIRRKRGTPSTHPLSGEELRALRKLQRDQKASRHVFMSERDAPLSEAGFGKTLARIGVEAGLPFPVHPHMLRHATGYRLANAGRDTRSLQLYMGHRNIQHTARYTELAAGRFAGWFAD